MYESWWVTVAAAKTREAAAAYGRRALLDGSGRLAGQVRVVTAAELRRMRGGKAVAEALAGIAPHGLDFGEAYSPGGSAGRLSWSRN